MAKPVSKVEVQFATIECCGPNKLQDSLQFEELQLFDMLVKLNFVLPEIESENFKKLFISLGDYSSGQKLNHFHRAVLAE